MTDIGPHNCRKAYFETGSIRVMLTWVGESEMDEMRKDPETGIERIIEGYPNFYTTSGRLWPVPVDGIDVLYV